MQDAKPIWLLMQAGLQCFMVCLPVLLFQFSGWLSFCHKGNVERPWCSSALPNIYSFVQSHYWGVGLLRYFKFQQVIVPQESGTVFPLCLGMHTKAIPMSHTPDYRVTLSAPDEFTQSYHVTTVHSSMPLHHVSAVHADTKFHVGNAHAIHIFCWML